MNKKLGFFVFSASQLKDGVVHICLRENIVITSAVLRFLIARFHAGEAIGLLFTPRRSHRGENLRAE